MRPPVGQDTEAESSYGHRAKHRLASTSAPNRSMPSDWRAPGISRGPLTMTPPR